MEKIKKWFEGKKSYTVVACAIITGIAQAQGIVIPDFVWVVLASLFGITYKAGQSRIEQSTKDMVEELKQAKNGQ